MLLPPHFRCPSVPPQNPTDKTKHSNTKSPPLLHRQRRRRPHRHRHRPANPAGSIGSASSAHQVLDRIPLSDTFAWNTLLRAHIAEGSPHHAVLTHRHMLLRGSRPDRRTLPHVLTACRLSNAFSSGRQAHAHALKLGFASDSYVVTALMEFYAQFEGAHVAATVFSCSNQRNSVCWTLLAKLYCVEDKPDSALQLFHQMVDADAQFDAVAFVTALTACGKLKSPHEGKKVHEIARRMGLEFDLLVGNALLKMYLECERIDEAWACFDQMPLRDAVSWTTVINGYVKDGRFNDGLKLFRAMCRGLRPDTFAVSAILPSCARMAAHRHGKEIHGYIIRHEMGINSTVSNALMDMYSKSGSIDAASTVFERMTEKDAISWTVMILGYSLHGRGDLGVALFHQMENHITALPDRTTLTAALHACSRACLVEKGRHFFSCIKELSIEHFALMVDLLTRAGLFDEARVFVEEHRIGQHVEVQRAMLNGCKIHWNVKLGKRIAKQLIELEPLKAENYILMSNMYAAIGKQHMAEELREIIRDMGLKPKRAYSWIEVRNKVHVFAVGDVSHPRSERIYFELKCLMERMEKEGHVPEEDFSLHDVDEERECIPCGHSEMLAIAFGLISTQAGTVRVTKNLGICRNCHASTKMIARIVGREIVLKDPGCFHHFKNGSCSCRDFW